MTDREKIKKALSKAVKALYFDDNSDYGAFLWDIVGILGGDEASDLLGEDDEKAFEKYCKE
jgi:hypothetical protein